MDAPSITVDQVVLRIPQLPGPADTSISFELSAPEVDPRSDYTVSALVDLDGDGELGSGDYTTMQSYPVLNRGHPDHVELTVIRVK